MATKLPPPKLPAVRAPVITSTSPGAGFAWRLITPLLTKLDAPTICPCNGPPRAMAFNALSCGRYCPVLTSVVAPATAGERQRSVVGETVVGAGAEIRYGHPQRIASSDPIGVGEVPQVEGAIVQNAVVATGKLHKASDGAVINDAGVVAGEERTAGDRAIG